MEGAAIGSAAVMLAYNLVKYVFLKVRLRLDPFSKETVKLLAVGVLTVAGGYLSPSWSIPFVSLLSTSLLVLGVFVGSSILLGVGKEEWEWLKSKVIRA